MVKIDENRCIGCGICANICPEGMEVINGTAKIKNENAPCIKEAAASCPRHAIILEGSEPDSPINNTIPYNKNFEIGRGRRKRGEGRGLGMGRGSGRGRKGQ